MPAVSSQTHRRLMALLQSVRSLSDQEDMEMQAMSRAAHDLMIRLAPRPAPKKTLPGVSKSVAKRIKIQTRKEKTSAVREAVMKRAGGFCECCATPATAFNPLELDHFRGGSLKRSRESVAGCWALVRNHHRDKTVNRPDAEHWRALFRMHLKRNHLPIPGDL